MRSVTESLLFQTEIEMDSWDFLDLIGQCDNNFLQDLEDDFKKGRGCNLEDIKALANCLQKIIDAHEAHATTEATEGSEMQDVSQPAVNNNIEKERV